MGDTDVGASERSPSLTEVLERARRQGDVHTCIPAKVVRYAGGRKVDVKILIKRAYYDEEEERQTSSIAVVTNVPIEWPGAGGYTFTCPISDGETTVIDGAIPPATIGIFIVAERSIEKWLSGQGGEVDPEIDHNHQVSDGMFVPELRTFGGSFPATPTDHAVIGKDGGVMIHMRQSGICIGDEGGASAISRADKTKTWLDAFVAAVAGWTPVANDGGAALKLALQTANIIAGGSGPIVSTDTGASQGKVQ